MYHTRRFLVTACLFLVCGQLRAEGPVPAGSHETVSTEPPFIIHYGLNDSHGRSWVRENSDGVVGITCFERFEGSDDEGTLIYKTILPDGTRNTESVTTGTRLEKSVLLYDALAMPHIFVAQSNSADQVIDHYYKDGEGDWQSETIIHFYNEGGQFIYELSADNGPDHSFHLLILKSRSDVDSDDFIDCWINSYLYHLTNTTGSWEKELVLNYDMPYTYDMCIKSSIRQDMKIDDDGYLHVAFGVQISGAYDPSRLMYATNKTGTWQFETALSNDYGLVDDAGWFPSICLDNDGNPYIACIYLNRVLTHSVMYSKLLLLERLNPGDWHSETVAEYDDGYYGSDGRDYTGALCHLVFDNNNTPHIIFSDIAATHYDYQRLSQGNIRYAVRGNDTWNLTTVYRQPLPTDFWHATEMLWMCLVVPEVTDSIRVIGQEIEVTAEGEYSTRFVEFAWGDGSTSVESNPGSALPKTSHLFQNYPNPFNPGTSIEFELPRRSHVTVTVHNILGQRVQTLADEEFPGGSHSLRWDGADSQGKVMPTGVYFYRVQSADFAETKKMILLK